MRGWIVFPFGANPWWVCLVSVVPAVLVTILIFMDQQITAVILNRREYKLQVSGAQGIGMTQPTRRTQVLAGPHGPGGGAGSQGKVAPRTGWQDATTPLLPL